MTGTNAPFGTYAPSAAAKAAIGLGRLLPQGGFGLWLAGIVRPTALSGLSDGFADVEALGLKLRLRPRANLSERRLYVTPHLVDPDELAAVRAAMGPGKVFVDIGANAGLYAFIAALAGGPDSRILAVEPQSDLRERLAYNAGLNGFSQIEIAAEALSNHDGTARFRIDPKNLGRSQLAEADEAADTEIVRVTQLATLLAERGIARVDAMKIDVEGHETLILKPFFETAVPSVWPGLLIMEKPALNAVQGESAVSLALEAGYELVQETRMNAILARPA
jgi:FkbM family methyltransferase